MFKYHFSKSKNIALKTCNALLLIISFNVSASPPSVIEIEYHPHASPVDMGIVFEAISKATVFWYQACGKLFSVTSISQSNLGPKDIPSRKVMLYWASLPAGKLAAVQTHSHPYAWRGSTLSIDPGAIRYGLDRVLTHEFGHILGLEHSDAPNAVMHQQIKGMKLSEEEIRRCK